MKSLFETIGLAGVLIMAFLVSVMAWLLIGAIARRGRAWAGRPRRHAGRVRYPLVGLANAGDVHGTGNISKQVDAAITERYLLAKVGSDATHIAVCGAADTPIGVVTDEATAQHDLVNVALLGNAVGTVRMVASGAITQGSLVEPAASGRVQTLSGAAGIHHVVGRALDAASNAGDVIEVDHVYFIREI